MWGPEDIEELMATLKNMTDAMVALDLRLQALERTMVDSSMGKTWHKHVTALMVEKKLRG